MELWALAVVGLALWFVWSTFGKRLEEAERKITALRLEVAELKAKAESKS